MKSEYLEAFERQLEWHRWRRSEEAARFWQRRTAFSVFATMEEGGSREAAIERNESEQAALMWPLDGQVIYVTPEICRVIARESEDMPDFPWTNMLLPCDVGFVVLGDPPDMRSDDPEAIGDMRFDAVGFGSLEGRTLFVGYHRFLAPAEAHGYLFDRGFDQMILQPGDVLSEAAAQTKKRVQRGMDRAMSFVNKKFGERWHMGLATDPERFVRFTIALFVFMHQKIFIRERVPIDRPARRRAQRYNVHADNIQVVQFRKPIARDGYAESDPRDVNWSCRWIVHGHKRLQYYPSLGQHIPIYIEPFIKGPVGKPLKEDGKRIFVVRR